MPRRRGRHVLGPVALRSEGPLGLGRWRHEGGGEQEVTVYPDVPAARRLALAVQQGRFRAAGRLTRGPLGLGTEFESIRDYEPDDDIRQVNWRATERMQRPMSNQYRVEQDREVMLLIDAGRLMASPLCRPHAARRGGRRRGGGRAGGRRARRPRRDARLRPRGAPPALPAARGRPCGGARAARPRAARRGARLRARLPQRRGRQALADADLLRPARGDRGAAADRRRAGALPPPCGDGRQRARPGPRFRAGHAAGRPRTGSARRPWRSTSSAPARASRTCCGGPARRWSRRPPTACRRRAWAPTCGPSREGGRETAGRATAAASSTRRPRAGRPPRQTTQRRLARAHEALDQAGQHQPRHRPEDDLDRRPRLAPQRRAARERPRVDDRPAEPQPGHAADRDARELEQAVREHEAQQEVERAVLDRQPEQRADEAAVEDRQGRAAEAEQDAARDGQERHLDVVGVDLARERGLLAGREVAGSGAGLGRALELAGDDPERRRRDRRPPRRRPAPSGRTAARARARA